MAPENDPKATRVALGCLFDKTYEAYQSDDERFWKLFNLMTLVNGGLLALVSSSHVVGLQRGASSVGLLLCMVWWGMQSRYGWWCSWWDEILAKAESQYLDSFGLDPPVRPFNAHWQTEKTKKRGFSTRKSTAIVPVGFAFGWIAVFLFAR